MFRSIQILLLTREGNGMKQAALIALIFFTVDVAADVDRKCHNLVRLTDVSHAVEPGVVVQATDNLPAYCHVRGVINRAIRFEVTMPLENWNGRFMFSTVGGAAGVIGDVTSLLSDGYAMASTDTGHEITDGDAFRRQPEALLDYAYRGVHLATRSAKAVVQKFYGEDIDYSYLSGCSNGGRAALMEVERFPDDYDGVIAGAPVYTFSEFIPWAISVSRAMKQHPLTEKSLDVLAAHSASSCDVLDGVEDGVINDPRVCTLEMLNLESLTCDGGRADNCLSEGEVETARTVYADLVSNTGEVVSPGVMPGAENAGDWGFWLFPQEMFGGEESAVDSINGFLSDLMRHDADFNIDDYDPANDADRIAREMVPLNAGDPDLSEFKANGGKLIIYQGWNDFPLRPQRAIEHLHNVESEMGGAEATTDFFRLFMVPGMTHCAGGPGAWQTDYVTPLVDWREGGKAPERIVGTQPEQKVSFAHLAASEASDTGKSFTRPQCVYPKLAQYRGRGDKNDAENYVCK